MEGLGGKQPLNGEGREGEEALGPLSELATFPTHDSSRSIQNTTIRQPPSLRIVQDDQKEVSGSRQPELSKVPLRKESCWGSNKSCGVWQSRFRLFLLDSSGQEERADITSFLRCRGGLLVASSAFQLGGY